MSERTDAPPRYSGEYPKDWADIATAAKDAVDWRCIRCLHRFEIGTGRPLWCDDKCSRLNGRVMATENVGLLSRELHRDMLHAGPRPRAAITGPHHPQVRGLSYTVHHFDGNKANNVWWNLMPTCNSCHLSVQARVIPERQYLFTHSAWILPNVCGFYAKYYGDLDIARTAAERWPDVFLRLGQPWLYEPFPHAEAVAVGRFLAALPEVDALSGSWPDNFLFAELPRPIEVPRAGLD